jgi:hypothetical protein
MQEIMEKEETEATFGIRVNPKTNYPLLLPHFGSVYSNLLFSPDTESKLQKNIYEAT